MFVTHSLENIRRFCDRALLLEKGLVRARGDPEEVIGLYREHVPVG